MKVTPGASRCAVYRVGGGVAVQAPRTQNCPAAQALAQAPQLLASVASAAHAPVAQRTCPAAQGRTHALL
jgi:hypothetical protein